MYIFVWLMFESLNRPALGLFWRVLLGVVSHMTSANHQIRWAGCGVGAPGGVEVKYGYYSQYMVN